MPTTREAHEYPHHAARRLRWYVALSRAALALAIAAIVFLLLGILCMPHGFVNPKSASSLFAGFQANGAFIGWARPLFEVAGIFGVLAVSMKALVRFAFRVKHE
jgi:hypothetical protein